MVQLIAIEVHEGEEWKRPSNDGRIFFLAPDGRHFQVRVEDGALVLQSYDGELLLHPISRKTVGLETPTI